MLNLSILSRNAVLLLSIGAQKIESVLAFIPKSARRGLLWEVTSYMISEVWIEESKGQPFDLWWYPHNYLEWTSNHPTLSSVLLTLNYAEILPSDNQSQTLAFSN